MSDDLIRDIAKQLAHFNESFDSFKRRDALMHDQLEKRFDDLGQSLSSLQKDIAMLGSEV